MCFGPPGREVPFRLGANPSVGPLDARRSWAWTSMDGDRRAPSPSWKRERICA
jgi:hypothetical protein